MNVEICSLTKKNTGYPLFDILKIILSLMIVAIHSGIAQSVLYPWLRIAVPLFFVISSFLFFCKIKSCETIQDERNTLIHFIKRNLILYLFYFVLLLPITLYARHYFDGGIFLGILKIIKDFFLGSTFFASWYIIASIVGTIIIYFLNKFMNTYIIIAFSVIMYAVCCLFSSYSFIIGNPEWLSLFRTNVFTPETSFLVSLIWISLGFLFSNKLHLDIKIDIIGLVISVVLLYVEWTIIKMTTDKLVWDVLFAIIPTVFFSFDMFLKIKMNSFSLQKFFRSASTITYATHYSILIVVSSLLRKAGVENRYIDFALVLIICFVISTIIFFLETKKYFKWLRYSH